MHHSAAKWQNFKQTLRHFEYRLTIVDFRRKKLADITKFHES